MTDRQERVANRLAFLRVHLHDGVPLASAARDAGVPIRTARRWLARFRDAGPGGLAPKPRSDAGGRKIARELVELIEGLAFIKPRQSAATIYRRVAPVARERGWRTPSYSTVHAIMAGLDPAALTLAHEGEAAFRDRFELVHRHRAERRNATWQADHTELDILILDANGKETRPWLTTVIDDHSRAVAGYMVFLDAPSALNTSLALRQAIWRKARPDWHVYGIPDVLYVDHPPSDRAGAAAPRQARPSSRLLAFFWKLPTVYVIASISGGKAEWLLPGWQRPNRKLRHVTRREFRGSPTLCHLKDVRVRCFPGRQRLAHARRNR